MGDYFTWKEFTDQVTGMLTTDADRAGIELYRPAILRQAVIRIQSLIPELRVGHEVIYYPSDLVVEGHASRGVLPPQAAIRDIWLVKLHQDGRSCFRFQTMQWPWKDRFALVNGKVPINGGQSYFSIDPQGYEFMVFPQVFDCWLISLFYDGQKLDFQDGELTPFTEMMAGAVADYMKSEIKREVDTDLALKRDYMQSFQDKTSLLHLDMRDRNSINNINGYGGGNRCGGRTVSDCNVLRPEGRPCYTNQILIGDHIPTAADVPDKAVSWFWKDEVSGGTFVWDVKQQAWI